MEEELLSIARDIQQEWQGNVPFEGSLYHDFVKELLERYAAQQSVNTDVITRCSNCGTMLTDGGDICFECSNVA